MIGNNFFLILNSTSEKALKITEEENQLWRKRLGHYNSKTLNFMIENQMVYDLPHTSKMF